MKNKRLFGTNFLSASCGLLLIAIGISASAQGLGNTEQFAVEMKMTSDRGPTAGQSMGVKFYIGKNRMRMETTMEGIGAGGSSITVFDGDQVTTYMIIPQMKQYMKQVKTFDDYVEESSGVLFGSPDDADHPCQSDPDMSCKKAGSDSILGRSVDKYLVTKVEGGVPTKSTMWFDPELLFSLKSEGDHGLMEATSIEIGPQPDKLFEIPSGYTEMQMPR